MQTSAKNVESSPKQLWQFFILTFLFSWSMWLPGLLISYRLIIPSGGLTTAINIMKWIGGMGPSLAALYLITRHIGKNGIKNLFQRLINIRLGFWYLPTILLLPAILIIAHLLNGILYNAPFPKTGLLSEPWWIPVLLIVFIIMQFSEELGWRGFALDELQKRWSALSSSVILGCIWGIWHIPMFLINGFGQHDNHLPFSQFLLTLVLVSIFITWLQNNTNNSLVPAFIVHSFVNLSGEALPLIEKNKEVQGNYMAWVIANYLLLISAIIVICFWGYQNLSRPRFSK